MGEATIVRFSGADRRATAVADGSAASDFRRAAAAWIAGLLGLAVLPAASELLHDNVSALSWAIAGVSGVLGLVTIVAWIGVWALSGRAWPAYTALALLPAWAVAEVVAMPVNGLDHHVLSVFAALLAAAGTLALARRALRASEIDVGLRPIRLLALEFCVNAAAIVALVVVLRGVHTAPSVALVAAGLLTALLWCAAAATCLSNRDISIAVRRPVVLALGAFALAACDRTVGQLRSTGVLVSWAYTCACAVALVGWCLLFSAAVRSLARARAAASYRQHKLRLARDIAARRLAEQLRRMDERRHDLRSLIAGIQGATTTLLRYREFLGERERRELEAALVAEIARLTHAIRLTDSVATVSFSLSTALEPVLVAERTRGIAIDADLPDAEVFGNPDAAAALVQNLVSNARLHAPGARVTLTARVLDDSVVLIVHDTGPGMTESMRRRILATLAGTLAESGVAVPEETRTVPRPRDGERHGLGLQICARLAREQGATLRLLATTNGTSFELTMRLAAVAVTSVR